MESGLYYLFTGYTSIWIVFFIYLLHLGQQHKKLRRELELLQDQFAEQQQRTVC